MAADCFNLHVSDHVAHLQLARPESLNTMTLEFWRELPVLLDEIDRAGAARVLVVSSTGKHFTAGMDFSVFTSEAFRPDPNQDKHVAAEALRHLVRRLQAVFSRFETMRVPVLAAVQGGCIGAGVDLVTACDVRYATTDAFFVIQEINIGMTADVGTFPRRAKLMPEGAVREMAYTGRRLPAARAYALGLVTELYEDHETMIAAVLETAREIASKNPTAIVGSKRLLNYGRDHSIEDTLEYIATWQMAMLAPSHIAESFVAKNEKRRPNYPDLAPLKDEL